MPSALEGSLQKYPYNFQSIIFVYEPGRQAADVGIVMLPCKTAYIPAPAECRSYSAVLVDGHANAVP